jgi:hypothetical protein
LRNSFEYSDLSDNRIIIEYELPYSTRRVDVLLFGCGQSNDESVVLIELKQWSNENVHECHTEGNILVDYGRGRSEQPHPSLQVQGYHYDVKDFLTIFSERPEISLGSCAYCHNYCRSGENPVVEAFGADASNHHREAIHGAGDSLSSRCSPEAPNLLPNR